MDASTGKTSSEAGRGYTGPKILRLGFRPFFLAAGIWSPLAVVLWLGGLTGVAAPPTAFDAVVWHAHEMLFGFVAAVIAGFLLTAIPNWTGRLPLRGPGLALLVGLGALGRAAVGLSALTGPLAAFTRVLAPLVPDGAALLIGLSGLAWIGAFGLFAVLYGPLLIGRASR